MGIWGMSRSEVYASRAKSAVDIDVGICRKSASCWGEKWLKWMSIPNFHYSKACSLDYC